MGSGASPTSGRAPTGRISAALTPSRAELLAHTLVDGARVGLAACLLHHLPDEEPEQPLLAAAELLRLAGIRGDDAVDHRVELGDVRDRLLREVRLGAETLVADLGQRLVERRARNLRPGRNELRQLRRVRRLRRDAGGDELVREDVRRLL